MDLQKTGKLGLMVLLGLALVGAPLTAACSSCCPVASESAEYSAPMPCCGEDCEVLVGAERPASSLVSKAVAPTFELAAVAIVSPSSDRISGRRRDGFSNDLSPPLPAGSLPLSLRI